MTVRLAVWSGPRNISTALMRSWENRADTAVVDEPLYSYYLTSTGIDHPGREEIIASQSPDLGTVVAGLLGPAPAGAAVFYQKQMCHHLLEDTDRSWIPRLQNVLLIRDPAEVVASYRRSRTAVAVADIGVAQQVRLLAELTAAGAPPPVLDAADFLADPPGHLRWLCDWSGVTFDPAMLRWPAGPRSSDGVWAPYWYAAVQESTGFAAPPVRELDLDVHDAAVAAQARPGYEQLRGARVRI